MKRDSWLIDLVVFLAIFGNAAWIYVVLHFIVKYW